MKIVDANSLKNKSQILNLLKNENSSIEGLDNWLKFNLGTDVFGAWIAYEKDKPAGILLCEVNGLRRDSVFISFLWGRQAYKPLIQIAEAWAKEKGINNIVYYSKNRRTAEKYGFKFIASVMTKEI